MNASYTGQMALKYYSCMQHRILKHTLCKRTSQGWLQGLPESASNYVTIAIHFPLVQNNIKLAHSSCASAISGSQKSQQRTEEAAFGGRGSEKCDGSKLATWGWGRTKGNGENRLACPGIWSSSSVLPATLPRLAAHATWQWWTAKYSKRCFCKQECCKNKAPSARKSGSKCRSVPFSYVGERVIN